MHSANTSHSNMLYVPKIIEINKKVCCEKQYLYHPKLIYENVDNFRNKKRNSC